MYGLISRIVVAEGHRAELASLLAGLGTMPGCVSYVVAEDAERSDALWVTEVWESAEAHRASLGLPQVRAAIEEGRPLIVGIDARFETRPIGGPGFFDGDG